MRARERSVALVALALTIVACGDAETAGDAAATSDPGPADEDAGGAQVSTGSTDLGEVLVADDGMTLYVFDPDEQGASTCYDECAAAWPPLTTEGEPTATGDVQADLLGTAEREDGALQVTYDGWPLYRWASDQAPGDVTGQGVQDVWWVVTGDGQPVREVAAPEPAAEEGADTGGY